MARTSAANTYPRSGMLSDAESDPKKWGRQPGQVMGTGMSKDGAMRCYAVELGIPIHDWCDLEGEALADLVRRTILRRYDQAQKAGSTHD